MKVAVSIPEPIFDEAERALRRLRLPRSQFYARAVQALARQHSAFDVTAKIDAALEKVRGQREPGFENPGLEILHREKW